MTDFLLYAIAVAVIWVPWRYYRSIGRWIGASDVRLAAAAGVAFFFVTYAMIRFI